MDTHPSADSPGASRRRARVPAVSIMTTSLLVASLAACGATTSTPDGSARPASSGPTATAATVNATAPDIGRRFVEALAGGDMSAAEAMEDATMRAAAPATALAELWAQFVAQFGAYQGIGSITTEPSGAYVNASVET